MKILNKQKYAYLMEENLEGLLKVIEYGKKKYSNAPVKEINGSLFIELPTDIFAVTDRDVTKELNCYEPNKYIDNINIIDEKRIEISAHVYIKRINIKDFSEQKISAFFYNVVNGFKIPLQVIPEWQKGLTDTQGTIVDIDSNIQTTYNYDGCGFRIILDINEILKYEQFVGDNEILIEYENRFSSGTLVLGGCAAETKNNYNNYTFIIDDSMVRISFAYFNQLKIQKNNKCILEKGFLVEDKKVIGKTSEPIESMSARAKNISNEIFFQTTNHLDFFAPTDAFVKGVKYNVYVKSSSGEQALLCEKRNVEVIENKDDVIIKNSVRTFELGFFVHNNIAVIKKSKYKNGKMEFWIEIVGNVADLSDISNAKLCVDDRFSGRTIILDEAYCKFEKGVINGQFEIDFGKSGLNKDFYQSTRDIYIEYTLERGDKIRAVVYSRAFFKYIVSSDTLEILCYRGYAGTARLRIIQKWKPNEVSLQKRNALTMKNYPLYRKEPINPKQILFESMWGDKYSCNPQALYEYIDRYYPEYECIWSLKDARTPIEGRGRRVRRGSQEYYHCLATSKFLVNNVNFATDYVKRIEQVEIQTMHGTPLKSFGLDVESEFSTQRSREEFIEKNSRWNYLVVQGDFMKNKAWSCFRFEKEILEVGYPRTDKLYKEDRHKIELLKKQLNLPAGKKIILYAPTWRVRKQFDMKLDLENMRAALSDDYIILVRIHYFCSSGYEVPEDNKFIFNLNSYRSIEDLYLVSDILITDYSSAMFDYALLDKPMLFFVYDLEEYCDKLRGHYVDFKKEAPGSLLYDSDEVIHAILNLEEEMEEVIVRRELFIKKYLTYECPNSAELVVQHVLQPKRNFIMRLFYKMQRKWFGMNVQ